LSVAFRPEADPQIAEDVARGPHQRDNRCLIGGDAVKIPGVFLLIRYEVAYLNGVERMTDEKEPVEINWPEDMSKEKREELRGLLTAYDAALAEFDNDHKVIFPSDAERNRLFFGFLKRWGKAWSKRGPCMHEGCTKTSIARSHTISLGASIRLIAENGHVLTPVFGDNGLDLVPIGVREASTFPGFCEEHEAQFAAFEAKKTMTEPEHFRLQAFRTICREIYTKLHQRQKGEAMLAQYQRVREEFVIGRIKQAHTGTTALDVLGLRFENDPLETKLVEMLDDIKIDLPELQGLYRDILDDLRNDGEKIAMIVANFDMQLAVCLSGLGVLNYMDQGMRKRGLCFLAIIPEVGQTKIMLGAVAEHKDAVRLHLGDESAPAILETLESWMIHGSDHWFMTPSAWAGIPHARQQAICDRILEPLSLADRAPFSVLDGTRRRIVSFIESQFTSGVIPAGEITRVREILAYEKAKLDYVPPVGEAV
jgi:hypothetical protein